MYSSAYKSINIVNLEDNGLLLDSIHCKWKGVLDTTISKTNKMLLGVSHNPDFFGIWGVKLKDFNLTGISFSNKIK